MSIKTTIKELEALNEKMPDLVKATSKDKFWGSYFPYALDDAIEILKSAEALSDSIYIEEDVNHAVTQWHLSLDKPKFQNDNHMLVTEEQAKFLLRFAKHDKYKYINEEIKLPFHDETMENLDNMMSSAQVVIENKK